MIYGTCPPEDWEEEPASASFLQIKSKEKKEEIMVVKTTAMLDENLQLLRRLLLFSITTRTLTQIANKSGSSVFLPGGSAVTPAIR